MHEMLYHPLLLLAVEAENQPAANVGYPVGGTEGRNSSKRGGKQEQPVFEPHLKRTVSGIYLYRHIVFPIL